jgi:hypothetical protein
MEDFIGVMTKMIKIDKNEHKFIHLPSLREVLLLYEEEITAD